MASEFPHCWHCDFTDKSQQAVLLHMFENHSKQSGNSFVINKPQNTTETPLHTQPQTEAVESECSLQHSILEEVAEVEEQQDFEEEVEDVKPKRRGPGRKKKKLRGRRPKGRREHIITDPSCFASVEGMLRCGRKVDSAPKRYMISEDEVKRRVGSPESLSLTELNHFLRSKKTRIPELRDTLASMDLVCKKSSAELSAITKLCEGEVVDFAEDLRHLTFKYTPVEDIVKAHLEGLDGEKALHTRRITLQAAKSTLADLFDIVTSDAVAANLDLATHGLAPKVIRIVGDILDKTITSELEKLNP